MHNSKVGSGKLVLQAFQNVLQVISRLGKEINDEDSIYYWAWKNDIPVYSPAITDGSIGDMLYFHSYKNPGLVIDLVADIRAMNDEAIKAAPRKTGMIILGGGQSSFCTLHFSIDLVLLTVEDTQKLTLLLYMEISFQL